MSAVDVKIGDDWHYNLSDWSVVGNSFPLIAGDMTGAAGAMGFTVPQTASSRQLQGKAVLLRDAHNGETSGDLKLGDGNGVNASITGFSKIAKLNVTRTAEAYSGTLRGYLLYVMGLCGLTMNISISTQIAARPVKYIGWQGNVLDRMKDLCVAQGLSLTLIGQRFVFRDGNKVGLISSRSLADYTWQASEGQLAQAVEVAWYDTKAPAAQLVYPPGGWSPEVPVFQVDAGEVQEYEIDLAPDTEVDGSWGMSATSIVQPIAVDGVAREYVGPLSVYTASGKDGLPIKAEQWTAGGGSMKLELLEGGSRIKVTITGSSETEYAPYQISMPSGPSDDYSSLRIYGAGMLYQRSVINMKTGLDVDAAPTEVAPIVDMPFLNSYESAWRAAAGALSRHSSAFYTITGTIGQLENLQAMPDTFFDGETIELDPVKHPYGNLEGQYFVADGLVFRIRSVTYAPGGTTFTAEQHANGAWYDTAMFLATGRFSMTADEFNAYYPAGITADQLSADPLRGASL